MYRLQMVVQHKRMVQHKRVAAALTAVLILSGILSAGAVHLFVATVQVFYWFYRMDLDDKAQKWGRKSIETDNVVM